MVLNIVIGGFALETLVQGIKAVVNAAQKVFPFTVPINFYAYLNATLAVAGTAALAFGPLLGLDLGAAGGMLTNVNTTLEYVALLLASPLVAFLFRQLQKISAA